LIFKETWHIKNISEFDTNQPIKMFKKIIDEEITIKENDRPVDFFIDDEWVFIESKFLKNQEKSISINRLITTTSAKNIAEKIISDIYLLINSQFLDISTDAKNIASQINLEKITDVNINEFRKSN
jgi:predicted metalloprotease